MANNNDGGVHITAAVPYTPAQGVEAVPDNSGERLLNVQVVQPLNVESGAENGRSQAVSYPVEDYTLWHWLACLFCNCCGCAFIAFVLNQIVQSAQDAGHFKLAHFTQKRAKQWMMTGVITGTIILVIWVIFFITSMNKVEE